MKLKLPLKRKSKPNNYDAGSVQTAVQALETTYQHRGLKFTTLFKGSDPVEASGLVDGKRFYFTFRRTTGTLTVQPYNPDGVVVSHKQVTQAQQESFEELREQFIAGEISETVYSLAKLTEFNNDTKCVPDNSPQTVTINVKRLFHEGSHTQNLSVVFIRLLSMLRT
jgi:hypothetical protein